MRTCAQLRTMIIVPGLHTVPAASLTQKQTNVTGVVLVTHVHACISRAHALALGVTCSAVKLMAQKPPLPGGHMHG